MSESDYSAYIENDHQSNATVTDKESKQDKAILDEAKEKRTVR